MTTEDDFQTRLDENPGDWQTRLVFADWLEERGDPRAEGFRALGQLRIAPVSGKKDPSCTGNTQYDYPGYITASYTGDVPTSAILPEDWHEAVPHWKGHAQLVTAWRCRAARREIEDAAALAFAGLPAERRAELLASPLPDEAPARPRKRPKRKKPKK